MNNLLDKVYTAEEAANMFLLIGDAYYIAADNKVLAAFETLSEAEEYTEWNDPEGKLGYEIAYVSMPKGFIQ